MKPSRLDVSMLCSSAWYRFLSWLGRDSKDAYRVSVKGPAVPSHGFDGFYTTRWVLACDAGQAVEAARLSIIRELALMKINVDAKSLVVEECLRLDGIIAWRGGGFAFWQEDDDASPA